MNPSLKIAVNTRFLIKNKLEGIGLFTCETMQRIVTQHPEIEFYFLFDRPFDSSFVFAPNVTPVVLFPPARHPFLWAIWFEISVAFWLRRHKMNLFISPDGYLSLNSSTPTLLVIHDLAFEHFPKYVPALARYFYRYFSPKYAHQAARIATVSESSKQDIVQQYGILPNKIEVVYNGAKEVYQPLDEPEIESAKAKHSGGKNYFLYVGAIHPRKNVANLLIAFEEFKKKTDSDFKLLIVGRKAWDADDVTATHETMQFKKEVQFLGHLPPAELGEIVGAAFALCYVSLFEGFGIPIVEAMQAGVPVITSNLSSMAEIGADAALLVNPSDPAAIAGAMQQLVSNQMLRLSLIEKGEKRVQKFTWDSTAQRVWDAIQNTLIQ